jgi:hypothetical protein
MGEQGYKAVGDLQLVKGFKGQALVTSQTQGATFPIKGNLNVVAGTVKFWVMPMDWKIGDNQFHHLFCVGGSASSDPKMHVFDFLLYKFYEWDTILVYGMSGELTAPNIPQLPMNDMWRPGRWHQIGFAWDSHGAALYVDGEVARRQYMQAAPTDLTTDNFRLGGPYFMANNSHTAIDELAIYNRRLSDQEMQALYRTELIEAMMPK